VVGVQHQDDVEVAGDLGVGLLAGQGVQEVGRDPEVVAGLDRVRAGPQPLVGGDDLGGLGHQPVGLAQVGLLRLLVVGVEGGRRRHRRPQGGHGAGPRGQGADQLDQERVKGALGPQGGDRLGQLGGGRQLQVVQQVDGLFEGGVLGQVGDVVAGVEELALAAVDVGDPGLGGDHALESLARCFSHQGVPPVVSRDGSASIVGVEIPLATPRAKELSTMAHRVTFIPGDGVGPELSEATRRVLEGTGVQFDWDVQEAGAEVIDKYGTPLPEQVLDSIRRNGVAIKGPLTTPIGTGFRSVNVALRKELDLYACLRPCKTYKGVRSRYEDIDLIVVRENHEDLYAGIEFEQGSDDARQVIEFLNGLQDRKIREDSGISIKPISIAGTKRIARFAFDYARAYGRKKVTAVTKANIMKHTDGLFYAVAREVASGYPDVEYDEYLVDNMCMQLVQKPENFDVLLLPNLYGDIISDLGAGLVGGLGVAPGANLGDRVAVFEATHGSAPKYKGQNKVNPMAMMFSGMLMLRHLEEGEAADRLERALAAVIAEGQSVTYDMKPSRDDPTAVGTSQVADAVIEKMEAEGSGELKPSSPERGGA
jgi:isocitrate dehydrogenase (NAD+)